MTSRQKRTLKRQIRKAVEEAIATVGFENFRKISWFPSNNAPLGSWDDE